jgi:hypothetical protein
LKAFDIVDVLIAKGVFLLVAICALVVVARMLRDMMKNRFKVEKSNLDIF